MGDTIAAISTPHGTGGIAVIRISGETAVAVAGRVFFPAGSTDFSMLESNRAVFGQIQYRGDAVDTGIATIFRAPRSYTGEDTVEISCHGGAYLSALVLRACIEAGARMADPGEFTRRAFVGGKITLTEAEAVGALIETDSLLGARIAAAQSLGGLSKRISEITGMITDVLSAMYVDIDYPGEALSGTDMEGIPAALENIASAIRALLGTFSYGKVVNGGINAVLLGKANAGKSSLFNLLTERDAAIITPIPGTTRDVLETRIRCGDFTVNLADTAGIREPDDPIEREGVARALKRAEESDLIVAVFDGTTAPGFEDDTMIRLLKRDFIKTKRLILVNKCDTAGAEAAEAYAEALGCEVYPVSAVENMDYAGGGTVPELLTRAVAEIYEADRAAVASGEVITRERQYASLYTALRLTEEAAAAIDAGFPHDAAGVSLEEAAGALAECDAKTICSDIVEKIFHNFCVGK